MNKDVPKNKHITKKQKDKIWIEINHKVSAVISFS